MPHVLLRYENLNIVGIASSDWGDKSKRELRMIELSGKLHSCCKIQGLEAMLESRTELLKAAATRSLNFSKRVSLNAYPLDLTT
jgi:hypothetical protein